MWAIGQKPKYYKIICVEASPQTFAKLQKICQHDRIELLNFAVCNNAVGQDVTFYEADFDTISTLIESWLKDESSRFYKACNYHKIVCKTIKFDDLIVQYGKPDLNLKVVNLSASRFFDLLCFEWAAESREVYTSS